MNTSVVLVPGAPVMVPELAGSAAAESAPWISRIVGMLRVAADGASGVRVYGTDSGERSIGDVRSTLARWGADLPVGRPDAPPAAHAQVPDAALIGWWLLDLGGIDLPRSFTGVADGQRPAPVTSADELVVVVADGAASLTPRAPVPEMARGVDLDARLTAWLGAGGGLPDPGPEVAEEVGWWSRPAWQVLADAVGGLPADSAGSWAPFGVGYHCATWNDVPSAASTRTGGAS